MENTDIIDTIDILDNELDNYNSNLLIEKIKYGCEHYLRKCKIIAPCCNDIYSCRLCHDEEKYDLLVNEKLRHKIDRFNISEIICTECNMKQGIQQYCQYCNTCFGKYYCDICHLFDDKDKGQFHCYGCGFCRIGSKDNFVHCDKCNMCVPKSVYDDHKCLNIMDYLCPICMDDLFTSITGVFQLKCSHYIHISCLNELLKTSYKCPMCYGSIVVVDEYNKLIDAEVEAMEMPDEYKNMMVDILCNDCHTENSVKFHIVGLKCVDCGGYNTRKI